MQQQRTLSVREVTVPRLGLGTWQLMGQTCRDTVRQALALGYRHIDTAEMYENERAVGVGISEARIPRDELFVTTKLWFDHCPPDQVQPALRASLDRLGLDHVDCTLIHWPSDTTPMEATLDALRECQAHGLTRLIGVSNFPPAHFDRAIAYAPIANIQVEHHPWLSQRDLVARSSEHDCFLTSYCPIARGTVLDDTLITTIAEAHSATPAQVVLAWHLHHPRVAAIPKSSSIAHLRENLGALQVQLREEEVAAINGLARGERLIDPDFAPDWSAGGSEAA